MHTDEITDEIRNLIEMWKRESNTFDTSLLKTCDDLLCGPGLLPDLWSIMNEYMDLEGYNCYSIN